MSRPNQQLIDDVLDALKRSDKPITSAQLHHRLPQYAPATLRSVLGYLSLIDAVASVKGVGRVQVYEIVRHIAQGRSYEWRPLQPARATVIPMRARGRIAPDVSDGPYVGMGGKMEWRELA